MILLSTTTMIHWTHTRPHLSELPTFHLQLQRMTGRCGCVTPLLRPTPPHSSLKLPRILHSNSRQLAGLAARAAAVRPVPQTRLRRCRNQ
jgi:hypothetical protein